MVDWAGEESLKGEGKRCVAGSGKACANDLESGPDLREWWSPLHVMAAGLDYWRA